MLMPNVIRGVRVFMNNENSDLELNMNDRCKWNSEIENMKCWIIRRIKCGDRITLVKLTKLNIIIRETNSFLPIKWRYARERERERELLTRDMFKHDNSKLGARTVLEHARNVWSELKEWSCCASNNHEKKIWFWFWDIRRPCQHIQNNNNNEKVIRNSNVVFGLWLLHIIVMHRFVPWFTHWEEKTTGNYIYIWAHIRRIEDLFHTLRNQKRNAMIETLT